MNRWPVLGLLLLPLSAVFMCWVVACVLAMKYRRMAFNAQLQDENNALRAALKKANDQAEHFEREWYLRGDQVKASGVRVRTDHSYLAAVLTDVESVTVNGKSVV